MEKETCWTLIRAAANGEDAARTEFVRRYTPAVRAYLGARWKGRRISDQIEDATQDVFLQCMDENGVLERVDPSRGGFRGFLYGVVRRVAQKVEADQARQYAHAEPGTFHEEQVQSDETSLSKVFDRAWARAVMKEAWELNRQRASEVDDGALRRVELLRLRLQENKPIREIAGMWEMEREKLHRDYAKARKEFKASLREIVGLHERCDDERLAQKCDQLLALLGQGS